MQIGDKIKKCAIVPSSQDNFCLIIESENNFEQTSYLFLHGKRDLLTLDLDFVKNSNVKVCAVNQETSSLNFCFQKGEKILTWQIDSWCHNA